MSCIRAADGAVVVVVLVPVVAISVCSSEPNVGGLVSLSVRLSDVCCAAAAAHTPKCFNK